MMRVLTRQQLQGSPQPLPLKRKVAYVCPGDTRTLKQQIIRYQSLKSSWLWKCYVNTTLSRQH